MVKPLSPDDFRATRMILEPDDFLIFDGEEPPPSDLVDEDTWYGIMTLPDDVSIRTSNHHGSLLRKLDDLWEAWIEAVGEDQDQLYDAMLDAADEFQAVIFTSLHGFYRQAISSLRNVLELTVIGTYCQVYDKVTEFAQWRAGQTEIRYGKACDKLGKAALVQPLDSYLRAMLNDGIFDQKTKTHEGGWARRLYSELSDYSHSRPSFTNVDMWQSNGPVYAPDAFVLNAEMYFQTSALCFILVKLARPDFVLPQAALQLFGSDRIRPMKIARVAYEYLYLSDKSKDKP